MPARLPFPYGNHKSELMEPFTRFTAVAAPLDLANVDTDRIIPARFLRKPRGAPGYASFLFHDVRFNADGAERRSEEHTSELQSRSDLVCRLLLEKKKKKEMMKCVIQSKQQRLRLD